MKNLFYLALFGLILLGIAYVVSKPTEAEYHHCLVTSTDADKSICESLKPQ